VKDRSLIANQLQSLLAAQEGTYKPFVSNTVNDALKLMLQSTKNFIDLSDKVIPKNPEILTVILNGSKQESLSAHEAIQIIRNQALGNGDMKALPESQAMTAFQDIKAEHLQSPDIPNVRANLTDEGANINVKAKKLIEDPGALYPDAISDGEPYDILPYEQL